MTNMTKEQVIARANEILDPAKTAEAGRSGYDSVFSLFDGLLFGAPLKDYYLPAFQVQKGGEDVMVYSKGAAYLQHNGMWSNIDFSFYQGELVAVKVDWDLATSQLLERLQEQFGAPVYQDIKARTDFWEDVTAVWQTPEKLIWHNYWRHLVLRSLEYEYSRSPSMSVTFAHRKAAENFAAPIIESKKQVDAEAAEAIKF
jgi:hypothetical protein